MKQPALDHNLSLKKAPKREFLERMEPVVHWAALVMLTASCRMCLNMANPRAPRPAH